MVLWGGRSLSVEAVIFEIDLIRAVGIDCGYLGNIGVLCSGSSY